METPLKAALICLLLAAPLSSSAGEGTADTRFAYQHHAALQDPHPLNDAWLGMPVKTRSGRVVGHVVDAPLTESGEIIELMIDTSGSEVPGLFDVIFVGSEWIELRENRVEVEREALADIAYS